MAKHILVDENFPGLVKAGVYYRLEGNLISESSITVTIPLMVTGWIKAGRWIEAGEWIEAGRWIKAGGWIKAGEGIEAGGGIRGTVKKVFGMKTSFYTTLTLYWPVFMWEGWLKIGCESHEVSQWQNFTDSQIDDMDEHALDFWKTHKLLLLGIYETMSKQEN